MDQSKTNIPQPPVESYPPPYGYYPQEDEISLGDLWRVLVKRKIIIFGLTIIVTLCSVFYALLATPVYKAEVVFLPPAVGDIQALNIQALNASNAGVSQGRVIDSDFTPETSGFHFLDVDTVWGKFLQNLSARSARQTIFDSMNLLDTFAPDRDEDTNTRAVFAEFNEDLTVSIPQKKKGELSARTMTLSMEGDDPILIAEIVNRIAEEAERVTRVEVISDLQAKVNDSIKEKQRKIELLRMKIKKQRLDEIERIEAADRLARKLTEDKMALLRDSARSKRLDRISRLQEAAETAHSLGIASPADYVIRADGNQVRNADSKSLNNNSANSANLSDETWALYTLGYEALEAEIKVLSNRMVDDPFIPALRALEEKLKSLETNQKVEQLKTRSNDDPFISGLRNMEYELGWLESIDVDRESVKTARLDQAAFPAEEPVKPNRRLIVMLGFVLGLMLSIFVAFFANFIESQREVDAAPE